MGLTTSETYQFEHREGSSSISASSRTYSTQMSYAADRGRGSLDSRADGITMHSHWSAGSPLPPTDSVALSRSRRSTSPAVDGRWQQQHVHSGLVLATERVHKGVKQSAHELSDLSTADTTVVTSDKKHFIETATSDSRTTAQRTTAAHCSAEAHDSDTRVDGSKLADSGSALRSLTVSSSASPRRHRRDGRGKRSRSPAIVRTTSSEKRAAAVWVRGGGEETRRHGHVLVDSHSTPHLSAHRSVKGTVVRQRRGEHLHSQSTSSLSHATDGGDALRSSIPRPKYPPPKPPRRRHLDLRLSGIEVVRLRGEKSMVSPKLALATHHFASGHTMRGVVSEPHLTSVATALRAEDCGTKAAKPRKLIEIQELDEKELCEVWEKIVARWVAERRRKSRVKTYESLSAKRAPKLKLRSSVSRKTHGSDDLSQRTESEFKLTGKRCKGIAKPCISPRHVSPALVLRPAIVVSPRLKSRKAATRMPLPRPKSPAISLRKSPQRRVETEAEKRAIYATIGRRKLSEARGYASDTEEQSGDRKHRRVKVRRRSGGDFRFEAETGLSSTRRRAAVADTTNDWGIDSEDSKQTAEEYSATETCPPPLATPTATPTSTEATTETATKTASQSSLKTPASDIWAKTRRAAKIYARSQPIPSTVRWKVWMESIGASAAQQRNPRLYTRLMRSVEDCQRLLEAEDLAAAKAKAADCSKAPPSIFGAKAMATATAAQLQAVGEAAVGSDVKEEKRRAMQSVVKIMRRIHTDAKRTFVTESGARQMRRAEEAAAWRRAANAPRSPLSKSSPLLSAATDLEASGGRQCFRSEVGCYYAAEESEERKDAGVCEGCGKAHCHSFEIADGLEKALTNSLWRILSAHVIYDCSLGYCQGMNYIAAFILLTRHWSAADRCSQFGEAMLNEEQCFWTLACVLRKVRSLFAEGMPGFEDMCQRLAAACLRADGALHAFLAERRLLQLFGTTWFHVLFAAPTMDFALATRVWDIFMVERDVRIFLRTALAILLQHSEALQRMDFAQLIRFCKHCAFDVAFDAHICLTKALQITAFPKL